MSASCRWGKIGRTESATAPWKRRRNFWTGNLCFTQVLQTMCSSTRICLTFRHSWLWHTETWSLYMTWAPRANGSKRWRSRRRATLGNYASWSDLRMTAKSVAVLTKELYSISSLGTQNMSSRVSSVLISLSLSSWIPQETNWNSTSRERSLKCTGAFLKLSTKSP